MLISAEKCGKIRIDEKGFLRCPLCGKRMNLKILARTAAVNVPVWCPNCKRQFVVDVTRGRSYLSRSPEDQC